MQNRNNMFQPLDASPNEQRSNFVPVQPNHNPINSPLGGSISMQVDGDVINVSSNSQVNLLLNVPVINYNNEDKEKKDDEVEKGEEEETETESLSSEFTTVFTVFISILIISTMSLLAYSNTTVGAYVQVQVTPQLPSMSSPLNLNSNQFILYTTQNENNINAAKPDYFDADTRLELNMHDVMDFIDSMQTMHPHLKLTNNNNEIDSGNVTHLTQMINEYSSNQDLTQTESYDVFTFTLASSINDFWQAKAYELAFVIAAFSGAWPYVKLLILLIIWLHPMKSIQRKKSLLLLDQLGKYSFIDLYVCIFMAVSFYLTISKQLKSGTGITVAVIVQIDTGVSTFAVATLASMLYSMIFIYFDEQKRLKKQKQSKIKEISSGNNADNNNLIDLNEQYTDDEDVIDFDCFGNFIEKSSRLHEWKYSKSFKIWTLYDTPSTQRDIFLRSIFLVIIICNMWLCIETIWTAPVRYNMEGLAGWAIDNNIRSYSILKTVNLLPSSTSEITAAWFCVIQYYITVIIAPILISFIIIIVWLIPLNYFTHNIICHLLFPLQAWNSLDVFLVGSVAASIELDLVSQWILNTNYPTICGNNGYIQNIFGTGCFSVAGNLTYGTLLLLLFVIIEWSVLLYTIRHINKIHQKYSKKQIK